MPRSPSPGWHPECLPHPEHPARLLVAQRINIGQKLWIDHYKSQQADKLAAAVPMYSKGIVRDYAKVTVFEDDSELLRCKVV